MILASDAKNDADGGDDDDAEAYLVEEAPKDNLSLELEAAAASGPTAVSVDGKDGHGALVQEILETQKQLESDHKKGHVEIVSETLDQYMLFLC